MMTKDEKIEKLLAELRAATTERDRKRIRGELHDLDFHNFNPEGIRTKQPRPEPPQQVSTTFRLSTDVHRRLQILAADEGKAANTIVEDLLREHLDKLGIPSRVKRER